MSKQALESSQVPAELKDVLLGPGQPCGALGNNSGFTADTAQGSESATGRNDWSDSSKNGPGKRAYPIGKPNKKDLLDFGGEGGTRTPDPAIMSRVL